MLCTTLLRITHCHAPLCITFLCITCITLLCITVLCIPLLCPTLPVTTLPRTPHCFAPDCYCSMGVIGLQVLEYDLSSYVVGASIDPHVMDTPSLALRVSEGFGSYASVTLLAPKTGIYHLLLTNAQFRSTTVEVWVGEGDPHHLEVAVEPSEETDNIHKLRSHSCTSVFPLRNFL